MFCILILWLASPLRIPGKSRMHKRACMDLCGGRSAMAVPTATIGFQLLDCRLLGHRRSDIDEAGLELGSAPQRLFPFQHRSS
jgi:hypothetical protein